MKRSRLCESPALYLLEDFIEPHVIARVLALIEDDALLASHQVSTHRGPAGTTLELPVALDDALSEVASKMCAAASLPDASLTHLRLRIYREGQGHPAHFDDYILENEHLVATVLLTLRRPEMGGETRFARAKGGALERAPASGDGLLWYNMASDFELDPSAWHEGNAVEDGEKITLAGFLYAPLGALAGITDILAPAPRVRERLYVITEGRRSRLEEQLMRACLEQQVEMVEVDADTFDFVNTPPLEDGAMLYRVGTSHRATVVEQMLAHPRVATFYGHPLGAHLIHDNQALVLARCGIPTPRAIFALTDDRIQLRAFVEHLGGFPVVLKVPGRSLGVGVMRISDWPTLFSVVDQVYASQGAYAILMSSIEPAKHWRVIVVGEQTCAYINPSREDDFRTYVDEDAAENFAQKAPPEVIEAARDACAVLGLEMGGVDVLEHESGRAYVLEVNFPSYFAHPFDAGSEDVAMMMLAHLRAKANAART